jgi:hypothetical protein
MIDSFVSWMFAPNTWNDAIVYLTVIMLVMIGGMFINKED